ncbi:hypothetical protein, partial [Methylogaea oryzae]|uniref:hypothetical protein n=1 Tax=Methylogaea oryzae TaxID=1295382 RepID=UPI0020D18B61
EETAAKAFNLSLPASSLAAALNRLAETSGLHLVYDAPWRKGFPPPGSAAATRRSKRCKSCCKAPA